MKIMRVGVDLVIRWPFRDWPAATLRGYSFYDTKHCLPKAVGHF